MIALAGEPRLTGRTRHRLSRFLKRPILQVEEEVLCIRSMKWPPTGTNLAPGFRWRDARAADLIR
jgi:hypothetical protein